MKARLHLIGIIGIVVLAGCLVSSSGPEPSGAMAPPASFNNAAPEDGAGGPDEVMMEEPSSRTGPGETEATPSWTSSSSGSVGCQAIAAATADVSLSDGTPLSPVGLGVRVAVRDPDTGALEPLGQHDLTARFSLRDASSGTYIEEGIDGTYASVGGNYKSLRVTVEFSTTHVAQTTVAVGEAPTAGRTCDETREEFREALCGKALVIAYVYRRGKIAYRGSPNEDVVFSGIDESLLLDPVVLFPQARD